MTYCLAIKINEGLVFASDSRTNAGLDNISTYSKMFTFNVGDRAFVILTSVNLSTSQDLNNMIEKYISKEYTGTNYHIDVFKDPEFIGVNKK